MADDLQALAAKYVALVEDIEDVRRAMLTCLTNGSGTLAPKPNGHDPHPPTIASELRPAKARRRKSTFSAKTAERKLIEAMRDNPGLSVVALANAAGSSRSATGERLRQMALRGVVEKSVTGRWKLKGEEPGPQQPSPN